MQLTVDSEEPLEHVLEVIGALYGVKVTAEGKGPAMEEQDQGIKVRH
jgi:hypothetical protein